MVTHKICKDCGKKLEIINFCKSKNIKDGYENKCKECRKNARKKYVNICIVCNNEFMTAREKTKYCSPKCQSLLKIQRVNVNCSFCKKEIEIPKNKFGKHKNYYCDNQCKSKHLKITLAGENNPNYKKVNCRCSGCGTDIRVNSYKVNNQKYIFCSNECYKKNIGKFLTKNKANYEIRECMNCNKEIKRKSYQFKQKWFCSKICSNQYNNKLKKDRKLSICDYCGKEFERAKSQFNGKHNNYCSRECQYKGWSKIYSGVNCPSYNHNKPLEERIIERKYLEYYEWRNQVYKKNNYTCQCCGDNRGGNLVAHHILNYSEHNQFRTDIENGITLCKICHKLFHDTYGYKNNDKKQLDEFINKF